MTRAEQIADAEANLVLLRGNVMGVLAKADWTCGGALTPAMVEPEFDAEGFTGDVIITRSGVRYRVTVDYA